MADTLVAVVSYNTKEFTKRAIESLAHQSHEVTAVVWDNNSQDGTVSEFRHYPWFYHSSKNTLWSPAVNSVLRMVNVLRGGWRHPGHKYVGFMNADIAVPPDGVRRMIEVLEDDPEVGIVAPTGECLGGLQDFTSVRGPWTDYAPTLSELEVVIKDWPPVRTTYVAGACAFMRASVWEQMGGLDETMPLGADDHDLCIRLKHAGYKIMVADNVFVQHGGHATGDAREWNEYGQQSWDAFNTKWNGYFATEDEAIKCHWGGQYISGYEKGTGRD